MYADGYKSLAALQGTSASGLAIEPQRLDGWHWKALVIGGGIMFYIGTLTDCFAVYIYSITPGYSQDWVYLGILFVCLPTFLICAITLSTFFRQDPTVAIRHSLVVLFQMSKCIEVYKSVMNGMETTTRNSHVSHTHVYCCRLNSVCVFF